MTRGRFFIVVKDDNGKLKMYSSLEFNGDMYIEEGSCGEDAAMTFTNENINSIEDFKKYVDEFNQRNYQYDDQEQTWEVDVEEDEFSFGGVKDIFDVTSYPYHSDYMFIRNLTDDVVEMKAENGIIQIQPDDGAVFHYDEFYDMSGTNYEDEWGAKTIEDHTDAIVYTDDVYARELASKHGLTMEEAWELINNHMDHPHEIISVFECVEDVAEDYISMQDVDSYISNFIDYTELGKNIVANNEGYYKFDSTGRVLYYMP